MGLVCGVVGGGGGGGGEGLAAHGAYMQEYCFLLSMQMCIL